MTEVPDARDAAWAEVHDPVTSAARLAEIAQQHPEFAEAIGHHPHSYPELRAWAAQTAAAPTIGPVEIVGADGVDGGVPLADVPRAPSSVTGSAPEAGKRTGWTRTRVLIAAAAAVVLVLGGGTWAAVALSAGGGAPTGAGATESAPAPATEAPSAAPLICPTMSPVTGDGGSGATSTPTQAMVQPTKTTRSDLISMLGSLSDPGAGIAKTVGTLPAGITDAVVALRAAMFVDPKAADRVRSLDGRLEKECGGHLAADLDQLIASVPTKTGDRITHVDDDFGLCTSQGSELGWSGGTRVLSCGPLIAIDYEKGKIAEYTIAKTDGSSPYPRLSGNHVVWTTVTETKQAGLTQPLFTGTLSSWDLSSAEPASTTIFSEQPDSEPPSYGVVAAADGFAAVGGAPSGRGGLLDAPSAPFAIYDVRGTAPTKVDAQLPSPAQYGGDSSNIAGALVSLWRTESASNVAAYLDVRTGKAETGIVLEPHYVMDDAGCQRIIARSDPGASDSSTDGTTVDHFIVVASSGSALSAGTVAITTHEGSSRPEVNQQGVLYNLDGGLALVGFDSAVKWQIPTTVATFNARVLGRIVMTNASGAPVIVDESTGKEITDTKDDVATLLRAAATETPGLDSYRYSIVQDGDRVVLTVKTKAEGTVALTLQRDAVCPSIPVPAANTPFGQFTTGG